MKTLTYLLILFFVSAFFAVEAKKPKAKTNIENHEEIRTSLQIIFNHIPSLEQNVSNLPFHIVDVENTDLISPSRDDQHVSVNPEFLSMKDTATALAGLDRIILEELYKIQRNLE